MSLSPSPLEAHELMTVQETAEYLRMPKPTVYYLLQKGELPGIQIGGRWRVKRSLLDREILHIEPEDTVQKQVNMLIAPKGEQRDNMSLIQRLLG
jgi:excisionase family DNA binding protein